MSYLGKGFAYPMTLNTETGDLSTVSEDDAVKAAIRMFLSTKRGERPLLEGYGMPDVVFANVNEGTLDVLRHVARQGLALYEPRIRVTNIFAEGKIVGGAKSVNAISVRVDYVIRQSNTPSNLTHVVSTEGL